MITPLFECDQTDSCVIVRVRVPHSRPRDFDFAASDCDFHFHSRPYLLHLRFPHAVSIDHDAAAASYDFDTGIATVTLVKLSPHQHFPNLACLSALLVSRVASARPADLATRAGSTFAEKLRGHAGDDTGLIPPVPPSARIEIVSSTPASPRPEGESANNSSVSGVVVRDTSRDGLLDPQPRSSLPLPLCLNGSSGQNHTQQQQQKPPELLPARIANQQVSSSLPPQASLPVFENLTINAPCYGFSSRYQGVFSARAEDLSEITALPNPDATPSHRRSELRRAAEDADFDPEHYVADFMLADEFSHVLEYAPGDAALRELSFVEKDTLVKLPRREYLADADASAAGDLAGIIYASCYDLRATLGERSVESAWAISRVSPTLAFLDQMPSVEAALRAAYTRALIYPLYRHVGVADAVLSDVKALFATGGNTEVLRARLMRTILDVMLIFENSTVLRIFSDIFMTDYLIWVQHVDDQVLVKLAHDVSCATVPRSCLAFDLHRLEMLAIQVANGECPDDEGPVWRRYPAIDIAGTVVRPKADVTVRASERENLESAGGESGTTYAGRDVLSFQRQQYTSDDFIGSRGNALLSNAYLSPAQQERVDDDLGLRPMATRNLNVGDACHSASSATSESSSSLPSTSSSDSDFDSESEDVRAMFAADARTCQPGTELT
jgi:SHQ1 protein